jgi:hypothetical protein
LSRKRPDLPPWLGKCLGQALAANPALRFAGAAAFAEALEAGLGQARFTSAARPAWRAWTESLLFWRILTACLTIACIVALALMQRR